MAAKRPCGGLISGYSSESTPVTRTSDDPATKRTSSPSLWRLTRLCGRVFRTVPIVRTGTAAVPGSGVRASSSTWHHSDRSVVVSRTRPKPADRKVLCKTFRPEEVSAKFLLTLTAFNIWLRSKEISITLLPEQSGPAGQCPRPTPRTSGQGTMPQDVSPGGARNRSAFVSAGTRPRRPRSMPGRLRSVPWSRRDDSRLTCRTRSLASWSARSASQEAIASATFCRSPDTSSRAAR